MSMKIGMGVFLWATSAYTRNRTNIVRIHTSENDRGAA